MNDDELFLLCLEVIGMIRKAIIESIEEEIKEDDNRGINDQHSSDHLYH